MKPLIIPTILVQTEEEAHERFQHLRRSAKWVQWDILNNTLVPTQSWADASVVRTWSITPSLELHLMTDHPEEDIRKWRTLKQVRRVIWHIEAAIDHAKLIRQCKRWKLETMLALSPTTPLATLIPYLRSVDGVLILGVTPGKNGQPLIPDTIKTVKDLKRIAPHLSIGFDGGITARNLTRIARAGATRLNMGSGIFQSRDPRRTYLHLQKRLQTMTSGKTSKRAV